MHPAFNPESNSRSSYWIASDDYELIGNSRFNCRFPFDQSPAFNLHHIIGTHSRQTTYNKFYLGELDISIGAIKKRVFKLDSDYFEAKDNFPAIIYSLGTDALLAFIAHLKSVDAEIDKQGDRLEELQNKHQKTCSEVEIAREGMKQRFELLLSLKDKLRAHHEFIVFQIKCRPK